MIFYSLRGLDSCYFGNQPLYFHQMAQVKLLGLKRGFLQDKVIPLRPKWPELAKKRPKQTPKYQVLLCQGPQQVLPSQPTTLFLVNGPM